MSTPEEDMAWAERVWNAAGFRVMRSLANDLLDPAAARRRVVEELLESHGATRGLEVDTWTLTTTQVDDLLAAVSAAAQQETTP